MKSVFVLPFSLGLLSTGVFSQNIDKVKEPDLTETVIRINFLGVPAFSFEKGLGNNITVRPEAGFGSAVYVTAKDAKGVAYPQLRSAVNPYLLVELRKYYNLQRRSAMGKSTANFAGNYLALFYRYNAYEKHSNRTEGDGLVEDVQCFGVWWGFQKNLWPSELFYINFSIGPGIKTNWMNYTDVAASVQVGFGMQW